MSLQMLDDRAVSRVVRSISAQLVSRGVETTIFCVTRRGEPYVSDRVEVVELAQKNVRTSHTVATLAMELRRRELDALIAHGDGPARAAVLARALGRVDMRLVIQAHIHYSSSGLSHRWLRDRFVSFLYSRADVVAGVSPAVVEDLEILFPGLLGKTVVIPNPAPSLDALSPHGRAPHPWLERDDLRVVISVGNVIPMKGHDTLLRAFELVSSELSDVRLLILGRFDNMSYLKRLREMIEDARIGDHVEMEDGVRNVLPYLVESDVFVHASRSEAFSLVLVEALAAGLPIVATDCPGGPSWILGDGLYGRLVPVDDPGAMAGEMIELLNSEPERRRLGKLAMERADSFGIDHITDLYLEAATGDTHLNVSDT